MDKTYKCPECNKTYWFLGWAYRHMVTKHRYGWYDNRSVYKQSAPSPQPRKGESVNE